MFTSGWLGVDEAFRLGFVREVVAPDLLQARAREKALGVAAMPLGSLVATKQLLLAARSGADEARRRESEVFRRLLAEREGSS
jgi:enoyl-CoA hydratase/carnithine racemase